MLVGLTRTHATTLARAANGAIYGAHASRAHTAIRAHVSTTVNRFTQISTERAAMGRLVAMHHFALVVGRPWKLFVRMHRCARIHV